MAETCNASSAALPLIMFVIIISIGTCGLLSVLIKDIILYRKKKALERGGITMFNEAAVKKNQERVDPRNSRSLRNSSSSSDDQNHADLAYYSKRNNIDKENTANADILKPLASSDENNRNSGALNESRSSSSSRHS